MTKKHTSNSSPQDKNHIKQQTKKPKTKNTDQAKTNKKNRKIKRDQKSNSSKSKSVDFLEHQQNNPKSQSNKIDEIINNQGKLIFAENGANFSGQTYSNRDVKSKQVIQDQDIQQSITKNDLIIKNEDSQSKLAIVHHFHKNKIQDKFSAFSYKNIQLQGLTQNQQSNDENLVPSQQQIGQCIQMLQNSIPNRDVFKIINLLYTSLVQRREDGQNHQRIYEPQKSSPNTREHQNFQFNSYSAKHFQANMKAISQIRQDASKRRFYTPEQTNTKFQTEQERRRYNQKRIVAKAFCNRDYGITALQEQLAHCPQELVIQKNKYKSIACAVATEAYRRLQRFLMCELQRSIKPLNREQMRSVYIILLNCRKNFEAQQCLTFYKFMKMVYNICSVSITEEAAIKLYIVIQRALKVRISEMNLDRIFDTMRCNKQFKAKRSFQNQRFQLHKIWTNELQVQLLELYKRNQELMKIRDYFKHKYLQNQHLFTLDSLRSRLHKILRVALRKVSCFCQKFGQERIPNLIKLNDIKVKLVLRSPEALNSRLLLVDMYLNDECDIRRLYQTVSAINQFIIMKDNQRINQIICEEPLAKEVSQKIQHNVVISKNKLREKTRTAQDQIYLMGTQQNYHHILSVQNGTNLHYYRKVHPRKSFRTHQHISKVVKQELHQYRPIELQTTPKQLELHKEGEFGGEGLELGEIQGAGRVGVEENSLQFMIRDEMKKYLGSAKVHYDQNCD